jgi:hypothetical protein
MEYHRKTAGHGGSLGVQGGYVKYVLSLGHEDKVHLAPCTFRLSNWRVEQDNYLNYIHVKIQEMLEHIVGASSTMYIGITGVSFHVARIRNVGSTFPEVGILRKNQHIYSCVSGSKTCVIEAIYIANNRETYKNLKGHVQSILPKLKNQYQDLFVYHYLKILKDVI